MFSKSRVSLEYSSAWAAMVGRPTVAARGRTDSRLRRGAARSEEQLRAAIEKGTLAAARPNWAGSSKLAATIARAVIAQHQLALLLSREGRHAEADSYLRALGMRYKLSPRVLCPADPALVAETPRSLSLRDAPLVFDRVLPDSLLAELRHAFRPEAAFWNDHGYPTSSFFSYRYDIGMRVPSRLVVEQAAQILLPLVQVAVKRLYGTSVTDAAKVVQTVEWWAHRRVPGEGHQLHFDLDETTLMAGGGVHHPLISAVLYLNGPTPEYVQLQSPSGSTQLPPTLVTTQSLKGISGDGPDDARAYLVWPQENRLLLFRGDRLHGVLPGAVVRGEAHSLGKARDPDRVTLMFGWWTQHVPPLPTRHIVGLHPSHGAPSLAPCMRLPRPASPPSELGEHGVARWMQERWRLVPAWLAEMACAAEGERHTTRGTDLLSAFGQPAPKTAISPVGKVWSELLVDESCSDSSQKLLNRLGRGSVTFADLFFLESFDQIEALGRAPMDVLDIRPTSALDGCKMVSHQGAATRQHIPGVGPRRYPPSKPADAMMADTLRPSEVETEVFDLTFARALAEQQHAGKAQPLTS